MRVKKEENMLIDLVKDIRHAEEDIFDAIKASGVPVALWGAGEIAWYVWTYLCQHNIRPVCFCDNDPAKKGTFHIGLPVYNYESLRERFARCGGKYHIIVSTGIQYKEQIFSQLFKTNEKNPVWYLRGYEVCGEKIDYKYFSDNISQFEKAYYSLADDFSKKVFVNVINAKISGDFDLYQEIMSTTEYFDETLVSLADDEVFLDVGAFKGDAIIEFVKRTKGIFGGIIAFEPDKKTATTLLKTITAQGISKTEIYNKGAWNKHSVIHFHNGREGGSRISESSASEFAGNTIEVDAIDNVLCGRRVTYMSMDIEGAEHNAICGAEKAIKLWKPTMAISVYHRREDLYDLLLLIKDFVKDYKFYLRHYTANQTGTVLFAIPPKKGEEK